MNFFNISQNKLKQYISYKEDSIKNTIIKLNNVYGLFQIILDANNKLVGTLTDGDIRRGILKEHDINETVEVFMNKNPIFSFKENKDDHVKLLSNIDREPFFLPILNNSRELIAIMIKGDNKNISQAIIMAGGLGSRLGELTKFTPKPMLKIKGKPVLEYCISQLENEGIKEIYISVNYLAEKIVQYIEERKSKSKIIPVLENNKLGTIGPLSLISKNITGPILVMNGDLLTNISLEAMISFHLNGMFSSTIASVTYESNIPCGVLKSNQMGHLESIDEKPTISYAVAGGLYILNKEVYDLLEYNKHYNMPDLLNDAVKKKYTNSLFPIHEKWKDIGRPEDYYEQ